MVGSGPRALRRLADEDLVQRVEGREADALEALYDRHGAAAFAYADRLVEDRPTAERLVRDAFLTLWRRPAGPPPPRPSVRGWILSMVGGLALGTASGPSGPHHR